MNAGSEQDYGTARWLLVRHGSTHWNQEGKIQGHTDTPLSDSGRAQAASLALALKGVDIAAAYASDLSRAGETARIALGDRDLSIHATGALRELAYGEWEGVTEVEAVRRDPERYARWHRGDPKFAAPGGESFTELRERVATFAATVSARHKSGNILIVSHGGVVRMLGLVMLGLPPELFPRLVVSRASLSVLDVSPDGAVLKLWNDISHYAPGKVMGSTEGSFLGLK
jgi:probable phosphoglycerate mutase